MKINNWGYENEQAFVKAAMVAPAKRADFKRFNVHLVEQIVLKYIQENNLDTHLFNSLVNAGLAVFDNAFNKYIRLPNAFENDAFLFSTYYINWVRKAIEAKVNKE